MSDAVKEGCKKVCIKTVDTDVVVIAISVSRDLRGEEIWVAFSSGKTFRYNAIHTISNSLGPLKSRLLPVFHAFTGCDTVSSFAGIGKKTAWDTWKAFPEISNAFLEMTDQPTTISRESVLPLLERFVVLMYDRTSEASGVNEARKVLFAHKGRKIDSIPPTQEALYQHAKRATYQAGLIWIRCRSLNPVLPSPDLYGWKQQDNGIWTPYWTSLDEAASSLKELVHCGCTKGCRSRCKCVKSALPCTALCKCGGDCA